MAALLLLFKDKVAPRTKSCYQTFTFTVLLSAHYQSFFNFCDPGSHHHRATSHFSQTHHSFPCETTSSVWLIILLLHSACFLLPKMRSCFPSNETHKAGRSQDGAVCASLSLPSRCLVLCVSADSTVTDAPLAPCLMPLVRGLWASCI